MERETFYRELRGFLLSLPHDQDGAAVEFGPEDNLFDLGLVNSFSIIRMIVFTESLTGCAIDVSEHDVENFYTLRGLYDLVEEESGKPSSAATPATGSETRR